jgi:undecaprenyl-diphosphatase
MQEPGIFSREYFKRLLIGFLLATIVLAVFGWFTIDSLNGRVGVLDSSVRIAAQRLNVTPAITSFMLVITEFGSTVYLTILGTVACIVFALLGWRRELVVFLIAMTGQIILHHAAKAIVQRPRPVPFFDSPPAQSYSFPSGHALASLCFYGVLAWAVASHVNNRTGKTAIWLSITILILLIGFSRVYIGTHYPTDIIAGFLAALVWTVAAANGDFIRISPKVNHC